MTENKNNPKKVVSDNILHHPTYLDCSYENIIPQKFIGTFLCYKLINKLFKNPK